MRQLYSRLESEIKVLPKRFGFTSAISQEGVSYLSRAFATTVAHDLGADVCIIETNWWSPTVNDLNGLGSVVVGKTGLNEVIVSTNHPNLAIVSAGHLSTNDRSIAARSESLKQILNELEERFDHLILDLPAVLATSEAIPLASLTDSMCMIVRQGVTSAPRVRKALDLLNHLEVVGVVLNQVETHTPDFVLNLFPTE